MPVVERVPAVFLVSILVTLFSQIPGAHSGTLSTSLQSRATTSDVSRLKVWIYFTDHGETSTTELRRLLAQVQVGERALERRATRSRSGKADVHDLPVNERYVDAVRELGGEIRHESRYFNAVSAWVTPQRLGALARLPFVRHVAPVKTGTRKVPEVKRHAMKEMARAPHVADDIDYGFSDAQHQMINTKPLHAAGYTGEGVRVAVLDTGFFLAHNALAHLNIVAEWDFINNDAVTTDEPQDVEGQMWHGTHSLGIIASYLPGTVVGTAWEAEFILAKTERLLDELQIEEDDFVAALEWADGLGADVVSSSLGYFFWYDYEDMDGNTAVTTVAVDIAASRGILVVTSAGNEGGFPWPTLNAPADADSAVTVGAVDLSGTILASSSRGPTYDGRIKPDVVAQGVLVATLNWQNPAGPAAAAGTSASAPLVAGASALILQRHPDWSPVQVRDALRATASQSDTPNNDYGWGIIDAYAAAHYSSGISVSIDVRPGSCDNPFNPRSLGVLPVLVLGSVELDVHEVDIATLSLSGAPALQGDVLDMAGDGGCSSQSPDGHDDLLVKFDSAEIASSMPVPTKGADVTLTLAGELHDGTPIEGEATVTIVGNQSLRMLTGDEQAQFTTSLGSAVPNPFNPTTRISYSISARRRVSLVVYDVMGRTVEELTNDVMGAGDYAVEWDAKGLPSGIYFYRLTVDSQTFVKKMVLLK